MLSDPLDELKKSRGHLPTKLELAKRNASEPHPEDLEPDDPSYAQQALGGIAAMARDIPGAEAAQAGTRALFRRQSYKDALSDIRGAEDTASPVVKWGNRIIGGTVAAAAVPAANVVKQGAIVGGLRGFLKADPASLGERATSATKEGSVDALAGKVAEGLGVAGRSIGARTLDRVAQLRRGAMEAADKVNYGKAAAEGNLAAANPTPQVVSNTMDETDIKPYIDIVRGSRTLKNADDATVLREAYKLMSERQGTLANRVVNANDFKAGTQLEKADIGAAKKQVLTAADAVMPSFRPAVYRHAELMREMQAMRAGADATNRIVRGFSGAAKNAEKNAPDAFLESIDAMTPNEARAALEGIFGRLKMSKTALSINPARLFGAPQLASRYGKIGPIVDALDKKAGNSTSSLTRAFGIETAAAGTQ